MDLGTSFYVAGRQRLFGSVLMRQLFLKSWRGGKL